MTPKKCNVTCPLFQYRRNTATNIKHFEMFLILPVSSNLILPVAAANMKTVFEISTVSAFLSYFCLNKSFCLQEENLNDTKALN